MAAITATTGGNASSSSSSNILRLDLDQRQRPMRGISIIIESAASEAQGTAAAAQQAAAATTSSSSSSNTSNNNSNAEMSLKSQAGMLLAFGDSSNTNTTATQASAAATKDNLETSYDTAATFTDTATTSITTTKIYPQLLLRIGESEDNGEIASTSAATSAAATTTSTIISCNALPAAAEAATAAAATTSGEIKDSDIVVVASQPAATAATASAAAAATSNSAVTEHTVKIQIESQTLARNLGKQISVVKLNEGEEMVYHQQQPHPQQQQHLQFLVSSGQYSPCETLDSGTGSDLESVKSPEIIATTSIASGGQVPKLELHLTTNRLKVSEVSSPLRAYSLTDSGEECDESSSSSLSCDSLHSGGLLPTSLLRDIHSHRQVTRQDIAPLITTKIDGRPLQYEADRFYSFHVNEHENFRSFGSTSSASSTPEYEGNAGFQEEPSQDDEDAFVGYRDVRVLGTSGKSSANSTIRSAKGTVRGVKNRVRNGVATFLQLQQPNVKNYLEKDMGKVVLYSTSMGIIRETYAKCANVKQILRTLLIKFEERDVFMSLEYQQEMRERMHDEAISVPQLFVEGQHIGDADTVERLNESGELRQMLKPYKSIATAYTCQMCGGYRLLPCPSCSGSKKSVHRNHFTAEFVALKCMNCDEVGLVKCPNC